MVCDSMSQLELFKSKGNMTLNESIRILFWDTILWKCKMKEKKKIENIRHTNHENLLRSSWVHNPIAQLVIKKIIELYCLQNVQIFESINNRKKQQQNIMDNWHLAIGTVQSHSDYGWEA